MKCTNSVQRDREEGHAMTAVLEEPQTPESRNPTGRQTARPNVLCDVVPKSHIFSDELWPSVK